MGLIWWLFLQVKTTGTLKEALGKEAEGFGLLIVLVRLNQDDRCPQEVIP